MMLLKKKILFTALAAVASSSSVTAFVLPVSTTVPPPVATFALQAKLTPGNQVMLIGPGFLQLVLAKTCKAAGLRPLIVAPQTKLDTFAGLVEDDDIMADSTIGMPEVGEEQFGNIDAIVFCAEDAILPASFVRRVLDYQDKGQSAFSEGGIKKVVLCAPASGQITKEKSMNWIPIFNNDNKKDKVWDEFVQAFENHAFYKQDLSNVVRFGSLLGGSTDGPDSIKELGINERMYKMSLEQYRDLKERAFDRYKLGVQVLPGNRINPKPANQDKLEKDGLAKPEFKETFCIVNGYPEVDRSNRHTVSQAVVQTLLREDGDYPKEMTILSKALSQFPSDSEWDAMLSKPEAASWPDPFKFDPAEYGVEA